MDKGINNTSDKRETIQYYDIFFGLFNCFVMSFMVLLIPNNLILEILAFVFIVIIAIGIIFTFKKKNPFNPYFVFGALICGSFYALPGLFMIPLTNFSYGILDFIIFGITISEIFYIVIRTKDSPLLENLSRLTYVGDAVRSGRAHYDPSIHYILTDPDIAKSHQQQALEAELKKTQERKDYNKKYKRDWIILINTISVIGFYICYFSIIFQ